MRVAVTGGDGLLGRHVSQFLEARGDEMVVPLVARAQVKILSETLGEPLPPCDSLPTDLQPRLLLDAARIRTAQPRPEPCALADLRCCAKLSP